MASTSSTTTPIPEQSTTRCSSDSIPKPYSVFFHPYLIWSQKLVSSAASWTMHLRQLGATTLGTPEAKTYTQKVRAEVQQGDLLLKKFAVKDWIDAMPNSHVLAECTGTVPFRQQILHEWKIITHASEITYPSSVAVRTDVTIRVRFPASLLPTDIVVPPEDVVNDCVEIDFDTLDFKNFAPHVPVLVHFHGGGFMSGSGIDDGLALGHVAKLVRAAGAADKEQTTTASPNNELITISVDYGLAPEHPFPVAVMDGLSVIEYLLSGDNNTRAVHISGVSAGSSLSLIIGLESFRQYPGRVVSIESQCPMLNPAANTRSYYMNQNCFPAMTWLRWCWRAYLSLDDDVPPTPSSEEEDPSSLEAVLRKDSNYSAWNTWKTKHPSKGVQRLVHPIIDLPDGLDPTTAMQNRTPPKITIRVNLADPLHDDGKEVADALIRDKKADLLFFQNIGLHVDTAVSANQGEIDKLFKIWAQKIFGGNGGDEIAIQKFSESLDAVGLFK